MVLDELELIRLTDIGMNKKELAKYFNVPTTVIRRKLNSIGTKQRHHTKKFNSNFNRLEKDIRKELKKKQS